MRIGQLAKKTGLKPNQIHDFVVKNGWSEGELNPNFKLEEEWIAAILVHFDRDIQVELVEDVQTDDEAAKDQSLSNEDLSESVVAEKAQLTEAAPERLNEQPTETSSNVEQQNGAETRVFERGQEVPEEVKLKAEYISRPKIVLEGPKVLDKIALDPKLLERKSKKEQEEEKAAERAKREAERKKREEERFERYLAAKQKREEKERKAALRKQKELAKQEAEKRREHYLAQLAEKEQKNQPKPQKKPATPKRSLEQEVYNAPLPNYTPSIKTTEKAKEKSLLKRIWNWLTNAD